MERRLTTILAADVVGYSRLMGADEAGTLAALKALRRELIKPKETQYHGRTVKLMGDGALMEFASVVDAVAFAVEVQVAMAGRNAEVPEDQRIVYRVGLNIGDIIVEGDDIYGDGVNVAARLEGLCEPGGVCLSRNVFNQVKGKLDLTFQHLGEREVKNIAEPVTVYRVVLDDKAAALVTPLVSAATRRQSRWPAVAAGLGLSLMAVVGLFWWHPWAPEGKPSFLEHMRFPPPDAPSIAVLPFNNISGDAEQEYFADGITDDLITDLSKISHLLVIARNSVFTYKGMSVKVQEVAQELGVQYVLEGSVRRADGKVRINAQLVDATTGHHLWAERYDRDYDEIFSMQDEVISRIVSALAVELSDTEQEEVARAPTQDLDAYDHYLRAEQHSRGIKVLDLAIALDRFRKAITLDPNFAEAHVGYARVATEMLRVNSPAMSADVARKQAYESLTRALAFDPNSPTAHSVLGVLNLLDLEFDQAVESARKAVSLKPGDAESYVNLALVLGYTGRHSEASAAMELALQLDPKPSLRTLIIAGEVFFMDRQYERAVDFLEDARRRFSGLWKCDCLLGVQLQLPMTYAQLGRLEDAKAETEEIVSTWEIANLTYYRILIGHHKRDEDLEHRLVALRKAGIPEWPLGFEGRPQDRLDGEEIKKLLFGKEWMGRSQVDFKVFAQRTSEDGEVLYVVRGKRLKGSASVEEDLLCYRFPETLMGRKICLPVYKNPDGTQNDRNQYVAPDAFDVHYFSVKQ